MEADIAAKAVELGTNTDFSLLSLFFRADIIVKSVTVSYTHLTLPTKA